MLELLVFRVEQGDRRTATDPDEALFIDADGVHAGASAVGERRVLKLLDLLGGRIETADPVQGRFREPDTAVRCRNRRMDAGRSWERQRKSRQLGRIGI